MGEVLAMSSPSMTAADVRKALMGKWSPAEYVHVNEAPQDAARQGRKIDVLVLSMWASRGHELDAVEIKVSYSDWKRELDNAAKADWWWAHVHRFWIAVPEKLAERIRPELPTGWGLLACTAEAVTVVVKPEKHTPEALPWQATVGIIRAACDAGPNALMRAEAKGREQGFKEGQARGHNQLVAQNLRDELARMNGMDAHCINPPPQTILVPLHMADVAYWLANPPEQDADPRMIRLNQACRAAWFEAAAAWEAEQ